MNYRKIYLFVAVIALASAPLGVQAYQILPNPNNGFINILDIYAENNIITSFTNNNFINIAQYGRLTNNGLLNNNNTLLNQYDLINANTGTINNNSYGNLYNDRDLKNYGTINNGGSLTNALEIFNYFGGIFNINSKGVLDNNGIIYNYSGGTISNNSGGSLTNNGAIHNYSGGTLTNNNTLINYGILTNHGTLDGIGTYTQTAGQTINNGSLTQTSIAIQGGSLSGTGTIAGAVTVGNGAIVHPGNSPGTLTINGSFSSSGNLLFDIGGLTSGQYSVLNIIGDATFSGGKIEFDFINGFSASAGNYWDFLLANKITDWNTLSFELNGLGNGLGWEVDPTANGERLLITSSVPLPSTMWLLGSGLLGLVGWRRFRKS